MTRNLNLLDGHAFDVLVLGGGIYGACVAWEATLRGLKVALVEKADFASATSANSLKIIHGGLRYLQHLDIKRLRESTRERTILMNIAPHLVQPLPVVIPTYGHGIEGQEVLCAALVMNHLLSFDCKRSWDPDKRIPWGELLSKNTIVDMLPFLPQEGLTGGALFYDAQVYNSERLVLSFLKSAVARGAVIANYVEATGFVKESSRVLGVCAKDVLTQNTLEIRGKMIVNTSGPWIGETLKTLSQTTPVTPPAFARAVNLVTKPLAGPFAFGLPAARKYRDDRTVMKRESRMLFVAPWRNHSIIGTTYTPFNGKADDCSVSVQEVQGLLDAVNQTCPTLDLQRKDVTFVHGGLLPCTHVARTPDEVQLKTKYEICDHRVDGIDGILSVTGVKYTTARLVAKKVVELIVRRHRYRAPLSQSDKTPLIGGDIERFDAFAEQEAKRISPECTPSVFQAFLRNYGTSYRRVLEGVRGNMSSDHRNSYNDMDLIKAQARFAVREEMAQSLTDVVFRRTELGSAGHPGDKVLEICASEIGNELGWDPQKIHEELQDTQKRFVVAA